MGMRCTCKRAVVGAGSTTKYHLRMKIRAIDTSTTEELVVEKFVGELLQAVVLERLDDVGVHELERNTRCRDHRERIVLA